MFNLFRTKKSAADAITAFVHDMSRDLEGIPAAAMSDPYCLGFLRMVGIHVASENLPKGGGMQASEAAFELALTLFAPRHARDVLEILPFLKNDPAFLSGTRDGDMFAGWKLLNLAPESHGRAALMRFFERAQIVEAAAHTPVSPRDWGARPQPQSPNAGGWETTGSGHRFEISRRYVWSHQPTPGRAAELQIICTVESSKEVNAILSRLRFRFQPITLRGASLVLGLFTKQPKGALVEAEAIMFAKELCGSDDEAALIPHDEDVPKLLRALTAGQPLEFLLAMPAPPEQEPYLGDKPNFLAGTTLENDGQFKSLYETAIENAWACQDATRVRQLSEGWYRRRTPGVNFK